MKAHLLYPDRDFDLQQAPPANAPVLIQDLELDTLFTAMAKGDKFLLDVVMKALLSSLDEPDTIRYRQDILRDCLENPAVVRDFYDLAVETIENEKKNYWGIFSRSPGLILSRSVDVLQMFVAMLKKLRNMAAEHAHEFASEGFRQFFAMLNRELDDTYFAEIEGHLRKLQFRQGVLISAELGNGNKGTNYILRKSENNSTWFERLFSPGEPGYTFYIADRDQAGFNALSELRDTGINLVANALAQSNDHILSFFTMLRTELAFYIGCLNLQEQLAEIGAPVCFPAPVQTEERNHSFQELYDVSLALTMKRRVVGNDANIDGKTLIIITGANQGGKSTFLRSIGLSQLMMQSGMFVAAESFTANVCTGLFPHYKREEDESMTSGKLDEELSRMSEIADQLTSNAIILFNESFAATNEREGSEIARQIVHALLEKNIKVFFVTHLYEFAHGLYERNMATDLFLRAERQPDGSRSFRLVEGEPLQTSYGQDVYYKIFGQPS
jgi:DNA mismatch repair ATPase MutS